MTKQQPSYALANGRDTLGYRAVPPPSMIRGWPVMNEDSSEARNRAP